MGRMSREKGKVGEREIAALLRAHGFDARRGQQHRGGQDSPDVIHNVPGVFAEVKRREKYSVSDLQEWLEVANRESDGPAPAIFHRRNHERWAVTMYADDFLALVAKLLPAVLRNPAPQRRPTT